MSYTPEPWNAAAPLDSVAAKFAAEEFRELKKYITKIPHKEISADYTFILSDAGKRIIHPGTDVSARAWTIPPNSSVAVPVGSIISIGVRNGAGTITLTQGSGVTLRRAGTGTTGNVALAANAWVSFEKVATDEWYIYGTGLP